MSREVHSKVSMLNVAYYQAPIAEFNATSPEQILGELARQNKFSLEGTQRDAWVAQIHLLQNELSGLKVGTLFFEFSIPRMGKRADVVILLEGTVFVVEFKVGSKTFDSASIRQVHDYALDLKNFHRGSHNLPVIPILIATQAQSGGAALLEWASDQVAKPISCATASLRDLLEISLEEVRGLSLTQTLDAESWATSGYLPTPTIVEAAQALYQNHSVEEIARSDAGAKNLNATTRCLRDIISAAHVKSRVRENSSGAEYGNRDRQST